MFGVRTLLSMPTKDQFIKLYIYYNTLYSQPFVDTALVAYPYDPYGTLENHGSPVMFHLETMEA